VVDIQRYIRRESVRNKKRISIMQTGMDYKTGGRSNYKKEWNQISLLYPYIYRLMHKWGFKQKVPRKTHVNTASKEEKERFKKEPERYWILSNRKKSLQ
jgi:Winged helix-turn helix